MQKLKKALKKLATFRSKPAQAAKKATAVKKKSQPTAKAPIKKAAAKAAAPAKKPAPKAAASKPKVAVKAKPEVKAKDSKKPAAVAAKAPVKAQAHVDKAQSPKKADKPAGKAPTKAVKAEVEIETVEVVEVVRTTVQTKGRKKSEPEVAPETEEEIVLLDAEGRRYCRVKDCDQASTVDGYCRYHYLLFWKNIQVRKKILAEGKLERYIEELTARYPDKYLDMLRKDLRSEKEFMAAIQELEIDEAAVDGEFEDEAQNYLDDVRGMGSETSTRDDDGDF